MTVTVITGARSGIGFKSAEQLAQHRRSTPVGTRDDGSSELAAAAVAVSTAQLDGAGVLAW
jgi:NAD(P)-dependent dehydrogenase (short-subunit alcohol dehydrogenase family)